MTKKHFPNLLNDYHLLTFDQLDSTNEEAKRLAKGGGSHGAVIWAKKQTGGKGRLGRSWISQEGNLFVSVLLQPDKKLEELPQLSFVAAVAVIEAMAPMFEKDNKLTCKWPNDILLNGKKLGGILLESFRTDSKDKTWVVVGVGINIDSCPTDVQYPATCLTHAGVELVSAKIILARFVHHFIECYNEWNSKNFAPIRKRWLASACCINERVIANLEGSKLEGIAEGIDPAGNLLLKLDNGKKQTVHAGDVFPAEMLGT
jgi:BirA family biotin operon repressor/biotin-[acetyl-CoA-carboxylase] ligase